MKESVFLFKNMTKTFLSSLPIACHRKPQDSCKIMTKVIINTASPVLKTVSFSNAVAKTLNLTPYDSYEEERKRNLMKNKENR